MTIKFKVFFVSFLVCFAGLKSLAAPEKLEGVLALVNSEIVLESDLKNFEKRLTKEGLIDELLLSGAKAESLRGNRKGQLDYLIAEKILDSEVRRLNLNVTMDRVENEIKDIAKRNNMSRADLMGALTGQGVNVSEYQGFMKTRIERQSLMEQEITSKIRVSDEEVLNHYSKNTAATTGGFAEVTLAHIYFNPKKSGGVPAAVERAVQVVNKLNAGQSFESLAEQHSEDPNFTQGGALGTFKTGESSKEFDEAVRSLEPGQVSGVVKAKSGVHVIKLVSRKAVSDPNFEKVKEKVRAELLEKAFQKQFRNWIDQKREDAFVKINS